MTINKSHFRRLTATILIGCAILLPAFIGRAPAHSGAAPLVAATALGPLSGTAL
jgi:hypothetical protein